jgi:hypothetical protein
MVLHDLATQLVRLFPHDRPKLRDSPSGEHGAQRRPTQPMEVVVACGEGVAGIAKATREIIVAILALGARVELIMEVRILDVKFGCCNTYDRSLLFDED